MWQPFDVKFDTIVKRMNHHSSVATDEITIIQLAKHVQSCRLQESQQSEAKQFRDTILSRLQTIQDAVDAANEQAERDGINHPDENDVVLNEVQLDNPNEAAAYLRVYEEVLEGLHRLRSLTVGGETLPERLRMLSFTFERLKRLQRYKEVMPDNIYKDVSLDENVFAFEALQALSCAESERERLLRDDLEEQQKILQSLLSQSSVFHTSKMLRIGPLKWNITRYTF
jgi:hypothetical protein